VADRTTEVKLGEVVVAHLRALGAEVYQEVDVPGGVADIVVRVGAELWIIELKTSLSLALILQAMDRRRLAHRVFIAAPRTRNMSGVAAVCRELGLGLLRVEMTDRSIDRGNALVSEEVPSRRWNTRPVALAATLTEEHKTHAKAGAVGAGGRWTPFRRTCEQLAHAVERTPGITLKAAIEDVKHHYQSAAGARASLAVWIKAGKVPGVTMRDGRLFPTEPRG
jgi:hypothetical protein